MSVADLKARTQQIFDLFNTHDVHAASAYFAEEAELRDVAVARPVIGPQQIAAVYARQLDAIPDSVVRIDRMVAEGDMVVVEWTLFRHAPWSHAGHPCYRQASQLQGRQPAALP